ncbi:MAG: CDP-glycerol--glycerophosphate glycerophosphotransferase, partial [Actinomycetota bacterium]|nr:CDP-glycerol--glycerophosphate glycerophosphotransferase [Actinomycetota bacterium]
MKKILPGFARKWAFNIYIRTKIKRVQYNQRKAEKKIRGKNKIRVVFFVVHAPIWKLDNVYRKMLDDDRFDPSIVICPYTPFGKKIMNQFMDEAFIVFERKGYKPIRAYNSTTGKWLDVKNEMKPDIIFFTNPHYLTKKEYYISHYLNSLTCYVPYAFMTPNTYDYQFNQFFHNTVWKAFYETPIH